jgi:hypothetical protein
VDVAAALGGEGRAILTAASATQHAYETEKGGTYTRFLVEGIETGAADRDEDGRITVDELHRYACEKLQEVSPAIEPKLYAVETGYRIIVTNAPLGDPKLRYRKEVEQLAKQREGKLSAIVLAGLESQRQNLGLAKDVAEEIHREVLRPYEEFAAKLQQYERMLIHATQEEFPVSPDTQEDLKYLQRVLGLTDESIAPLQRSFVPPKPKNNPQVSPSQISMPIRIPVPTSTSSTPKNNSAQKSTPQSLRPNRTPAISKNLSILAGVAAVLTGGIIGYYDIQFRQSSTGANPAVTSLASAEDFLRR